MTTIMLCYFITPILNELLDDFLKLSKNIKTMFLVLSISIWVVISLLTPSIVGYNIAYLMFYTLSFYIGSVWNRQISKKKFILFTIITLISMTFRLIMRSNFDDTNLYDVVVVSIGHSIIGIYIFVLFDQMKFVLNNIVILKIINHFDKISYEMFITHYAFIIGPFFIWGMTNNIILDSILIITAAYLSALLLRFVSRRVISKNE